MKHFISLNKRSKKEQRETAEKKRVTWGDVKPVTKIVPSAKIYNRNKMKYQVCAEF